MRPLLLTALVALTGSAFAVTPGDGPGGVGTTDGASQLELWTKADSLTLANGDPVATWQDASGKARTLSQPNAASQPVFVTGAVGGRPVVRFTGDYFASLTLPSTGNEFTLVAVMKPTKTGAYHNIIDDENSTRPMLWIDSLGNYEFNFNSGAVAPVSGGYDVVFAVKRNTGPPFSQLYVNGPAVSASGSANFTVDASEVYDLFNRDGTLAFTGDVAELIIYSTALTPQEIEKVGYYLQQKYSLLLNFPPPFPVLSGYQVNPATYLVDTAIAPNSPIVRGGVPTGFSITPGLPAGLAFNPATGVISGTPTAVTPETNYTVTASFTGQADSSTQLSLAVLAPALLGYSREPGIFTRTRIGTPIVPLLRGGPPTTFSVSPALPPGLTLDAKSGTISGTPSVTAASASYTVTAAFNGYPSSNYALTLEVLELSTSLDISEFMASNDSIIADGDGAYSDWIEIHNYGTIPIDLAGWSLTDNSSDLRKWVFPTRLLAPDAYLIVFASGDSSTDSAGYLHAAFKLDGAGEYLALVQPDGTTIARQFSPTFPPQSVNVSYGTRDGVDYGAFTAPTPGVANGFFTAVSNSVTASPTGRTFLDTLTVTLSAQLSGDAVIRYTLDGTAPTAGSPVYTAPFTLNTNTRLRTGIFQTGFNPGPETSEVYLRLGADLQTFSSNLPLLFLSSDGTIAGASSTTLTGTSAVLVHVDANSGRAAALGVPDYAGRSGLRIRGRSSQSFPQKQYKFSTWDGTGREANAPLLGLASSSDWVLNAPWSEKSLVRNALAYRTWETFGRPSLGTRFVEVFINDDGDGQFTYADDYAGIYMLVEAIKLDVLGLNGPQNTTTYSNITGGYITETGNADSQDFATTGSGRTVAHSHTDPDVRKLNATQRTWIRDYITTFEQALYGAGFKHPTTGLSYSAYTDVASQVDYKIAREWSRNYDGGSTFSSVPRGGKLTMGPLWDYNWAFGNVNYAEGGDLPGYRTDGWNRSFTSATNGWAPWWLRFEQDPDWWQQFIDRWTDLRDGLLSDTAVNSQIDSMVAPLAQEAAARHFARWPQLGVFTAVSPPGWETRTTYASEVDYLKTWLRDRSAWIDSQFPGRPGFSRAPGHIVSGSSVTLTAPAGPTIYYTTDGSDPRQPGGAVNPAAASTPGGGAVQVNSSILLTARLKNGTTWGAPMIGAFVTGTAASAENLVISEISYHPSNPTAGELGTDPILADDDFEFLELRNLSAGTIDLTGTVFKEGVQFTFPVGTTLGPGAYVVVAKNAAALALRYGSIGVVAGEYSGNLNNSGDTIVLVAADGAEIARLHYSDAWTPAADGRGYTLTLRDPGNVPASYSAAAAWAVSAIPGGSPGVANGPVFTNEFTLWQQTNFGAGDLVNTQRSGLYADPDADGAANLLEFALSSAPLDAASRPSVSVNTAGSDLEVSFTRPRQPLDLSYTVEESSDLSAWAPVTGPLEVTSQTNDTETVRVIVLRNASAKMFFRVRVIKAN